MRTNSLHFARRSFVNQFLRQNIAEIDEIPLEEHLVNIDLPPAEMAIYMELDAHLKSLEMDRKKATRSKKNTTGDKARRMQDALEDSADAEEALLKRCSHFDLTGESENAMGACDKIIEVRQQQFDDCIADVRSNLEAAFTHRKNIVKADKDWEGEKETTGLEVADMLERFVERVANGKGVIGFTDAEINAKLASILELAEQDSLENPDRLHQQFLLCQFDDKDLVLDDEKLGVSLAVRKAAKNKLEKSGGYDADYWLYRMKYALREHSHQVNAICKELAGRMRSLRYFRWVRDLNDDKKTVVCDSFANPRGKETSCGCENGKVVGTEAGVLSCCGHVGCLDCLKKFAAREECVCGSCTVAVSSNDLVAAKGLCGGENGELKDGGKWGAKLTSLVGKVAELVKDGDRVIVFVQFKDLKEKVSEALSVNGVKNVLVKGTFSQQIKALDFMQKDVLATGDPRVLLLTMDDESSSGINLTNANHAVFVHPLLADGQQMYNAYETQAIGRIRRYGQKKTCKIWRYLCNDTIDTEIYKNYGVPLV